MKNKCLYILLVIFCSAIFLAKHASAQDFPRENSRQQLLTEQQRLLKSTKLLQKKFQNNQLPITKDTYKTIKNNNKYVDKLKWIQSDKKIQQIKEQTIGLRLNQSQFSINRIDPSRLLLKNKLSRYGEHHHVYGPLDVYPKELRQVTEELFKLYSICQDCKGLKHETGQINTACKKCLTKPKLTIGLVKKLAAIHLNDIQDGVCCVLTDNSSLKITGNKIEIVRTPYKKEYKEQNVTKFDNMSVVLKAGSGFLIRKKWVLTARHNLKDKEPTELHFVFNYYPNKREREYEIIKGKKVIKQGTGRYGRSGDWVIIELDRAPKKTHLAKLGKLDEPILGKGLFMLGHPRGLPLMSTINGYVYKKRSGLVYCNLDAFAGNSGSPVYSTDNLKIIGMMVRGYSDHKTVNGQLVLNTSGSNIILGREKFIELNEIINFLKQQN